MPAVEQYDEVLNAGFRALAPPEDLTPSQWAEKHLYFSPRFTDKPGPVTFDHNPYIREPLDTIANRNVREVTFMGAAQFGKTTLLKAAMGYAIDQDPGPCLFMMDSTDNAKSFSESRLYPLLEDCPRLARHLPQVARKRRLLEIPFTNNVQFALVGSNSPGKAASRSIRWLFCDEVDKYRRADLREAGTLALVEKRVRAQSRSKIFKTSTPTNTEGDIFRSFVRGDQQFYWVPCPHCNHYQPLVFGDRSLWVDRYEWEETGRITWDQSAREDSETGWNLEAVRQSAYYECGRCKEAIANDRKYWMLDRGEWRPEASNSRHKSYQIAAWYATWESCNWGEMAVSFLEKKAEGEAGLHDWTNSDAGEPWEVLGDAADEDQLLKHRLDYPRGSCPIDPLAVVITADVQRHECYWVVRAYGPYGARYLVDYGVTPGMDELAKVAARKFWGKSEEFVCTYGLVDSGDQTSKVYEFCDKNRWTPIKGYQDQVQPIKWGPGCDGKLLNLDTSYFKDTFQTNLVNDLNTANSWNLPENAGYDFARHLTSESKQVQVSKTTGRPKRVWVQLREQNHWLDCEVYQEAACMAWGLDKLEGTPKPKPKPAEEVIVRRRDGRAWGDR